MNKILGYTVVLLMVLGCGGSSKLVSGGEDGEVLKALLDHKAFRIEPDWALPQLTTAVSSVINSGLIPPGSSAGRINLMGSGSFLEMKGDSVRAYLPYYGERHAGGGYGANAGITFDGEPRKLTIYETGKNGAYQVHFDIRNASESFDVDIVLQRGLAARIGITSSQRQFIRYEGTVSPLSEDQAP